MHFLFILLAGFPLLVLSEAAIEPSPVVDNTASIMTELSSGSVENQKQLNKIDQLVSHNARGLALHFIQSYQPELSAERLQDWLVWERKRIDLLREMENWQQIIDRFIEQKSNGLNVLFAAEDKNTFVTQQVEAYLQLNQPEQALMLLRDQVWTVVSQTDQLEEWRRLIIRSYLGMRRIDDAQRAMRRYRLDYGMDHLVDDQWVLLQAQILIDSDHPLQAIKLLENNKSIQAEVLLLLARLQANVITSEQAEKQARKRLKAAKKNLNEQHLYWYVILRAALLQQNYLIQVEALEAMLELKSDRYLRKNFSGIDVYVSADSLWQAYRQAGLQLANEFNLLRGDDEAWYLKASNLFATEPRQARCLFATLSLNALQDHHRQAAFENLATLLEKKKSGIDVIHALFMKSKQITSLENIPAVTRYVLVDYSLANADLATAAKLMAGLSQPPEGEDDFGWNLRRARVLILGGQYQEGTDILVNMLSSRKKLQEIQIDQYLQVVFDLQNVQSHQQALVAFEKLEQYPLSKKVLRELAFWEAESYQALNNQQQAAWLFLKSAQPVEGDIDPWYHTAIFRAAEAMGKAGLIKDAREQYIHLLRITGDETRKSVIRQRLQQLRLQQSNQFTQVSEQ